MNIGILGTGGMAKALGAGWALAGHDVTFAGRSTAKAQALAASVSGSAHAGEPRDAVAGRDAVLLAVHWDGVRELLPDDDAALAGTALIDPINAVDYATGQLLAISPSVAEQVAAMAPRAGVVKAFHLVPVALWERASGENHGLTVAMCGDDPAALAVVGRLATDLGAASTVVGGLDSARQLEEAAGFALRLALRGIDPHSVIPALAAAPN